MVVVLEERRLGYNRREAGFYYMKIFVFEKGEGGERWEPAQFLQRETPFSATFMEPPPVTCH